MFTRSPLRQDSGRLGILSNLEFTLSCNVAKPLP